jgi:hypothetical protein
MLADVTNVYSASSTDRWAPTRSQLVPDTIRGHWPLWIRTSASTGSGHDADDLSIGGEPTKRLLGAGYTVVDADLKDAPT